MNEMNKTSKIHNQIAQRAASSYRQDKELCEVKTSFPPNLKNKTPSVAERYTHTPNLITSLPEYSGETQCHQK
jgi:hypothetical protein